MRPMTCERRIAELRRHLRETRAETDSLMVEAMRLAKRVRRTIDVADVQISVAGVQDALDRSYPER